MKRANFVRWRADWLSFTLVLLLAFSSFGSVLIEREASDHFQSLLDENWRGAFDILATASDQDFGSSETSGFVDGNFVATAGSNGISTKLLESIRKIADVDVAAPIGMVGQIRDLSLSPMLYRGYPEDGSSSALAATITSSLESADDSENRVISVSKGQVFLGAGGGSHANGFPMGFSPMESNQGQMIPLGVLPAFPATVLAVDPQAEQELLRAGGASADFLDPLISVTPERDIKDEPHVISELIDEERFPQQYGGILGADPQNGLQRVVPMVVNDSSPAGSNLRLNVDVSTVEVDSETTPNSKQELDDLIRDGKNANNFTIESDFTSLLRPFSSDLPNLTWPDSGEVSGNGGFSIPASSVSPELIGRPTYSEIPSAILGTAPSELIRLPKFMIQPLGHTGPDGLSEPDPGFGTDNSPGTVDTYREAVKTDGVGFSQNYAAPVGIFDLEDLPKDSGMASYVPYGAYDQAEAVKISAKGVVTSVSPNLSGLDFLTGPPGAITDLQGGTSLRGAAPIDAIRIRVSSITDYSSVNRTRVAEVASQVSKLGLKATVVAGSSLQPVALFLPAGEGAYDRGWMTQNWTSLGAVYTVEDAFDSQQLVLLATSLIIGVFGLLGASILTGTRRREETAILRSIGWSEAKIRHLNLFRYIPSFLLAAVSILAIGFFGEWSMTSTAISGIIGAAVVGSTITGIRLSTQSGRMVTTRSRFSLPVHSSCDMARRILLAAPGLAAAQIFGAAFLGSAGAAATVVILQARRDAGTTRLAELANSTGLWGAIALGATGLMGSTLTLLLARKSFLQQRVYFFSIIKSLGFSSKFSRLIHWNESVLLGISSILLSGALGLAVALASDEWWALPFAMAGAAFASLLVGLMTTADQRS